MANVAWPVSRDDHGPEIEEALATRDTMNATAGAGSAGSQAADAFFGEPVTIVAVVTIVLSTLFVGMRFWSRGVIIRVISLEDWFLLLGWVGAKVLTYLRPGAPRPLRLDRC